MWISLEAGIVASVTMTLPYAVASLDDGLSRMVGYIIVEFYSPWKFILSIFLENCGLKVALRLGFFTARHFFWGRLKGFFFLFCCVLFGGGGRKGLCCTFRKESC